jgi:hypothetical protein
MKPPEKVDGYFMDNFLRFSKGKVAGALLLGLLMSSAAVYCQSEPSIPVQSEAPIPVMTGSVGYFTKVTAGQIQDIPSISPLLLVPVGDNWLIEAKGSFSDTWRDKKGEYGASLGYGLSYGQIDYIANRYMTVVGGRFVAPFGIYGERLAPNWIRNFQATPLSVGIASGSALGGMLRGGFNAGTTKVNLNYAVYFSANNTSHIFATDRSTGARVGFFVPALRLEAGASFQQLLQADRSHSVGGHFIWQPYSVPLSVRSEFVRSSGLKGNGYWVEGAYRLSQIQQFRRVELVGRAQQFFAANVSPKASAKLRSSVGKDTNQADFGLNYYLRSDLRIATSYGRQFMLNQNSNQWVVGMTYRFVMPLGPKGSAL